MPPACAGASKDATIFTNEGALEPQASCLVEKGPHLSGHVPESRGSAKDDGIVLRKFIRRRKRRLLLKLRPVLLGDFERHRIWNSFYHHISIRRANSLGKGLGHDFVVAIH